MSEAADPAEVPIRPAATLLLVDDRPELQVLLLRRRKASSFVGGMYVFPGGGVDPEDGGAQVEALSDGPDEAAARRCLGLSEDGLAHWMAAIRETFEESGVLLARSPGEETLVALDASPLEARFSAHRSAVDEGEALLVDVLSKERLRLATDHLHYVARWITPQGPPRRYDTRFFVARAPARQPVSADETEAVDAEWVRPVDALRRFQRGDMVMMPPTVGMLRILSGFANADEAVASARVQQAGPDRQARVMGRGGVWRVVLPGDEEYRGEDDGTLAWVRWSSPSLLRSEIQGPPAAD